jgi:hypothetical protein
MSARELWIGMVELKALPGSDYLTDRAGAFTNIVTWASDAAEFRRNVALLAAKMQLYVVEIENEEPIADRERRGWVPSEEIEDVIQRARSNQNAIIYSTFHTYRFDTA